MSLFKRFFQVSLLLVVFFKLPIAFGNGLSKETCVAKTRLTEEMMTPSGLHSWLNSSSGKINSVEDFICCLPEKYLKNYVVGHSSIAGQPGIPKSPRVIAFAAKTTSSDSMQLDFTALSVNGGHISLNQNQNVELMHFNPSTKQLELFDIDFSGSQPLFSGKNPDTCMSCHGGGDEKPIGGPRPIFDSFGRWNRFVGGRSPYCTENEKKFFESIEGVAVQAVKENPRFRCLDKSILEKREIKDLAGISYPAQFHRLSAIDVRLNAINRERVSKIIRSYKNFPGIKYGLFGLFACGGSIQDWMPMDVTAKFLEMPFLRKEFRASTWRTSVASAFEKSAKSHDEFIQRVASQNLKGEVSEGVPVDPPKINELRCSSFLPEWKTRVAAKDSKLFRSSLKVSGSAAEIDILERLSFQKALAGDKSDPALQALFETLGEDTSFWQMSATGEGQMSPLTPLESVMLSEFKESFEFKSIILKHFDVRQAFQNHGENPILILNSQSEAIMPKRNSNSCSSFKSWVQNSYQKSARKAN